MPQTAAAKGALRQSRRRRVVNDRWRDRLMFLKRKFSHALESQHADQVRTLYTELQSTIDRMARRNILHRNTAARYKSRFAAKVAQLSPHVPPAQ